MKSPQDLPNSHLSADPYEMKICTYRKPQKINVYNSFSRRKLETKQMSPKCRTDKWTIDPYAGLLLSNQKNYCYIQRYRQI